MSHFTSLASQIKGDTILAKKKKKKNQKLKKQLKDSLILTLIISGFIYVAFAVIILLKSPTETFILQTSSISEEESKVGYIIREEYIIEESDNVQEIEPIKVEGERVAAKKPVFKYYSVDQEEISQKINELNSNIQEALLGQKDLFSSDIKALEGQIEEQIENIKKENNMQNIKEYKNNLSNYIVKKAKIAGSLSAAGTYINNLISERASLERELTEGSQYIYSNNSGIVSYRIDGLENDLSISNMDNITTDYLSNLELTTGQIVSKSKNKAKVINNFECYIAVPFDKEVLKKTEEGKKINLRLSNQDKIKAEVYKIKEDGNKAIIFFKITDDVEKLISYRKISIDVIWWEYNGLMAPNKSILYENGLSYLMRKRNGRIEKVLVKIIKQNDNFSIVDNYSTEQLAELSFTSDEINSMYTIKLYDEILVEPELENKE